LGTVAFLTVIAHPIAAIRATILRTTLTSLAIRCIAQSVTADKLYHATCAATVPVFAVAVVTFLTGLPDAVSALRLAVLIFTRRRAPVAIYQIAIVTLFFGLQNAVAAIRTTIHRTHGTGFAVCGRADSIPTRATVFGTQRAGFIALHFALTISALVLPATRSVTPVSIIGVAVVALLGPLHHPVAAQYLVQTARRASVKAFPIAVVALFAGIQNPVTAKRRHASHPTFSGLPVVRPVITFFICFDHAVATNRFTLSG
jgi:hypothetical protein